jgi:hypothetical protein
MDHDSALDVESLHRIVGRRIIASIVRLTRLRFWHLCGRPMEETRCTHPGCHAVIGGTNHQPRAGNQRLTEKDLSGDPPKGYDSSFTASGPTSYSIQIGAASRGSPISIRILRLFIHMAMRTSALFGLPAINGSVGKLMYPNQFNPDVHTVIQVRGCGRGTALVCGTRSNAYASGAAMGPGMH